MTVFFFEGGSKGVYKEEKRRVKKRWSESEIEEKKRKRKRGQNGLLRRGAVGTARSARTQQSSPDSKKIAILLERRDQKERGESE